MAVSVATANEISNEAQLPLLNGVVEGSVDFKGHPAVRSKSGCWKSSFYILGVEISERLAYFGIRSNLINYLTGPMGQSTATAAVNVNVWIGMGDLSPLLGAFVGDAFLGRYRAIIIASVFYVLGLGALSLSAVLHSSNCKNAVNNKTCSNPTVFNNILFFSSLYLIALMQGGHRPCLQAFGADQFDEEDEKERKAKASFFNWWNFSFAAGRLIAFTVLNYVQDNISWELGYGIPTIVMLFALLVFSLGTRSYRFRVDDSNKRNPFARIGSVFVEVVRSWKPKANKTTHHDGTQFSVVDEVSSSSNGSPDYEKACCSDDMKDAKTVLKLVPLWFTSLGFGIVTAQPATLFTKQGATMERTISSSFQIPAASLQSLLTISMIILLPVYDLIFVPIARKAFKNSYGITTLQRIGVGHIFSITTMIIAGFVERKRLETAVDYGLVDTPKAIVPMSISWLVPQYVVLGISHCFGLVGLQELFYDEVPSELKSLGVALYLSVFGIGSLLSSFLVSVIDKATSGHGKESWFSDNLNRAHLDYFYWLVAALSIVAFVAYLYFAKSYFYTRKAVV